jgi:hypothetical protein
MVIHVPNQKHLSQIFKKNLDSNWRICQSNACSNYPHISSLKPPPLANWLEKHKTHCQLTNIPFGTPIPSYGHQYSRKVEPQAYKSSYIRNIHASLFLWINLVAIQHFHSFKFVIDLDFLDNFVIKPKIEGIEDKRGQVRRMPYDLKTKGNSKM